jgi:hypothetical protein
MSANNAQPIDMPRKTKAQAHLDLVHAAKLFGQRQTEVTYAQLVAAINVARSLKLY